MHYDETQKKRILRAMERDLLALVAVDLRTEDFEVLYSDGGYRDYANHFRGERFFEKWNTAGMLLMHEDDHERMHREIAKDYLLDQLSRARDYCTLCRFLVAGSMAWCRIKVAKNVVEQGNLVISIRTVEQGGHRQPQPGPQPNVNPQASPEPQAADPRAGGALVARELPTATMHANCNGTERHEFMQTRDVDDELSLLSSLLRLGSGDNDAPDVAGLQDLEDALQHIRELAEQQKKDIYIRTFGRFCVLMRGKPVPLRGKAKEILALVVTRRGREISNEEIYSTLWEGRPYSNANMTVYYNALHRLRQALEKAGIQDLLVSGARGQMVDTTLFDCDYYDWMDGKPARGEGFQGEFLSEYSWGEYLYGTLTKGDGEA